MPRALLSVSDKTGIVDLGRGLAARGFELVSTGGTARALSDAGLAVTERVRGDRLSRNDGRPRQDAAPGDSRRHPRAARSSGRSGGRSHARHRPVDLVVVNLYPFAETAREPGVTFDELVEQIDIGGPCTGPRRGQELPRCARRRRSEPTIRRSCWQLDRRVDRRSSFASRSMQKAIAHTAAYDIGHRADAVRPSRSTAGSCISPATVDPVPSSALGLRI